MPQAKKKNIVFKASNNYTVQRGDTLWSISKETGYPIAKIVKQNKIKNPDKIYIGDQIKLSTDKEYSLEEIPEQYHPHRIIDDYSKRFDYLVQGENIFYKVKGGATWANISQNENAKKNLYRHIGSKYNFKGYSNVEKAVYGRLFGGNIPYVDADQQPLDLSDYTITPKFDSSSIQKQKPFKKDSAVFNVDLSGNLPLLPVENAASTETASSILNNLPLEKVKAFRPKAKDSGIQYYTTLGKNYVKRVFAKRGKSNERISSFPVVSDEYIVKQPMITGDTVKYDKNKYFIPERIDLGEYEFGFRNRNDLTPIENTEGAVVTAFNNFQPYNEVKNRDQNSTYSYIGINPETGRLRAGNIDQFNDEDVLSRTYKNRITGFVKDEKNNQRYAKWNDNTTINGVRVGNKGNPSFYSPLVNMITDSGKKKIGALNFISRGAERDDKTFGSVTGGRLIADLGDKQILISGSVANIREQLEPIIKEQGYVDVYTLDNGSYVRALRTFNKNISKEDLKSYYRLNKGGGNFAFIRKERNKSNAYPENIYDSPNVRTKDDPSYKKGHPLINELKGIVLHHTASFDSSLSYPHSLFMKPKDPMDPNAKSSHVVIGFNGERRVYADPTEVTFHSGPSVWNGRNEVNDFMLGIEFQGDTGRKRLTEKQIESAIEYLLPIVRKYNIPLKNIVTHKMVAPGRKSDISDEDYRIIFGRIKKTLYERNTVSKVFRKSIIPPNI